MKGCRALEKEEIHRIMALLGSGHFAKRNQMLIVLGLRTGWRASELLSLRVGDVWRSGQVLDLITVAKKNTKGKVQSRTVRVHDQAKECIREYIAALPEADRSPDKYLFSSRKGFNKPLSKFGALAVLKEALSKANIQGPARTLGLHALRKTFARNAFRNSNKSLAIVQKCLGHQAIATTLKYVEVEQDEVDRVILAAD